VRHKLGIAGLGFVVAISLVAAFVPAALAQFTSNKEHTILSGSQKEGSNDIFTTGEGFGGIACVTTTFSGTATTKSETTQVIQPSYENCKDSFGRTVDVDNGEKNEKGETVNKLTYTLTSGAGKGSVHITGAMTLTVTSGGSVICTLVFNTPQTDTGITFTNLGGTKGVESTTHIKNVISTTSGGFFNCGIGNGKHEAGTYDGTEVLASKDTSGAAAEISVD
jgi:hypothetical protein